MEAEEVAEAEEVVEVVVVAAEEEEEDTAIVKVGPLMDPTNPVQEVEVVDIREEAGAMMLLLSGMVAEEEAEAVKAIAMVEAQAAGVTTPEGVASVTVEEEVEVVAVVAAAIVMVEIVTEPPVVVVVEIAMLAAVQISTQPPTVEAAMEAALVTKGAMEQVAIKEAMAVPGVAVVLLVTRLFILL
jgi:hypothetical protein